MLKECHTYYGKRLWSNVAFCGVCTVCLCPKKWDAKLIWVNAERIYHTQKTLIKTLRSALSALFACVPKKWDAKLIRVNAERIYHTQKTLIKRCVLRCLHCLPVSQKWDAKLIWVNAERIYHTQKTLIKRCVLWCLHYLPVSQKMRR